MLKYIHHRLSNVRNKMNKNKNAKTPTNPSSNEDGRGDCGVKIPDRADKEILSNIYDYLIWAGMLSSASVLISESPIPLQEDKNDCNEDVIPKLVTLFGSMSRSKNNQDNLIGDSLNGSSLFSNISASLGDGPISLEELDAYVAEVKEEFQDLKDKLKKADTENLILFTSTPNQTNQTSSVSSKTPQEQEKSEELSEIEEDALQNREDPNQEIFHGFLDEEKLLEESDLSYYQEANDCMEKELDRLKSELTQALYSLDEETKLCSNLQCCISDLKQKTNDIDQNLCFVTAERDQLCVQLDNLMKRLESCRNAQDDLQTERDELHKELLTHKDTLHKNNCFQAELQEALGDCCATVDDLTAQVGALTAQFNKTVRERDDLCHERDELKKKLDFQRDKINCLTSAAQKNRALLQAHHVELDKIFGEKTRLEELYRDEKHERQELERKLIECRNAFTNAFT